MCALAPTLDTIVISECSIWQTKSHLTCFALAGARKIIADMAPTLHTLRELLQISRDRCNTYSTHRERHVIDLAYEIGSDDMVNCKPNSEQIKF